MNRETLLERYRSTRSLSLELCEPLEPEEYRIQSMTEVSPPWWNLGHTTWFFAKNILDEFAEYGGSDARLEYVLNSYYTALGPRIDQGDRGRVSRPTTGEVIRFRRSVDERMERLLRECGEDELERIAFLVITGIQHEQQHQELLLSEVKHIQWQNPPELREPYATGTPAPPREPPEADWVEFEGGLREIGNREGGWCWDNERPVHRTWLEDFALGNRLVTNGEYLEFIEDGGYEEPLLWLSNGFARARAEGWSAPLYWERADGEWSAWTLTGARALDPDEPVCHVSFYEADAFARWKGRTCEEWRGARLPTEREWEHAARTAGFDPRVGNLLDACAFHPRRAGAGVGALEPALAEVGAAVNGGIRSESRGDSETRGTASDGESNLDLGGDARTPLSRPVLLQTAGDLWEWTSSHYEAYPGFEPFAGSLQEYNGKFMDNQRVLRGGSCATPANHVRVSYRNFWPPETRFQFTGLRLAKLVN